MDGPIRNDFSMAILIPGVLHSSKPIKCSKTNTLFCALDVDTVPDALGVDTVPDALGVTNYVLFHVKHTHA